MRKFIKIFVAIVLFVSLKIQVYAAPNDPVMAIIQAQINNFYNISVSDQFMNQISDLGYNETDNYYLWFRKSSSYLQAYVYSQAVYDETTNKLNCSVPGYQINYELRNGSVNYTTSAAWNVTIDPTTDQIIGYYNDLVSGKEYSASIPNFSGGMKTIVNEEYSSPNVPIVLTQNKILLSDPDYSQYNLEVKIRFALPTLVTLYKVNGSVQWDFDGYVKSEWEDLWTYEDDVKLTQTGVNQYTIALPSTISSWTDLYNDNINNVDFQWEYNELNSVKLALFTQFKEFNLPMAGVAPNIADMYVRYTKKDGAVVKYGRWTHIVNNQFSVVPPESIFDVPEVPSQGQSILDNQTVDDQINNNLPDPYVLPNINVVNTVNMPDQNTLNYPTITTYNQDHLLKYAMDTAEDLPGLFSSITAFCQIAFAFIRPEIWAIIGFGFALSIVVMFLKIL